MLRAATVLHQELVNRMTGLGYQTGQGMCFGLAHMGMMTILEGKTGKLNDILLDILNLTPAELATLKDKASGKNKALFSEKERTIVAFFDGVELYHVPDKYNKLFDLTEGAVTQDQKRAMPFLSTDKLKSQGGIKVVENFIDVYKLPKLIDYLTTLRKSIHSTHCALPFVVMLESSNHTICIHYDLKKNAWLMIDAGNLPVHEIHGDEEMAKAMMAAFICKDIAILSSNIYLTSQNEAGIRPCLDEWRMNMDRREDVRPEKVDNKDSFDASWLYLAAQKGRRDLVKKLLETGANADQASSYTGATPLYMAVQEGHLKIMYDLMLYGADPNKICKEANVSPLGHALDDKNWQMAAAILIGLKNSKKINTSDLSIINQNRHALADAFCKLMEHDNYREHYAEFVNDVLASRNALGAILNEPTDSLSFLFSKKKHHDIKVTESIKQIGEWFDDRQASARPAGNARLGSSSKKT